MCFASQPTLTDLLTFISKWFHFYKLETVDGGNPVKISHANTNTDAVSDHRWHEYPERRATPFRPLFPIEFHEEISLSYK